MARLKCHLEDSVCLVLVDSPAQQVVSVRVRCHYRASDVQISLCHSSPDVIRVLINKPVVLLGSDAVLHRYDHSAVILDGLDHLFSDASDRTSCYHDARSLVELLAVRVFSLDLCCDSVKLISDARAVKLESASVEDLEHVKTCYRAWILLHRVDQVLLGYSDLVLELYSSAEIVICDLSAELLLNVFSESQELSLIELESLFALRIRQIHDEYVLEVAHQLVHLLLAVACVLADNDVAEIEERTLVLFRESIAGLDERTEVGRKIFLSSRDGLARSRAKAYRRGTCSKRQLCREVRAVRSDDWCALIFNFLYVYECVSSCLGEFFEYLRQFCDYFHLYPLTLSDYVLTIPETRWRCPCPLRCRA